MGAGFEHVGDVVGGRYELRGGLGHGGFADVYRAWDRFDEREVALKVLRIPDHLSVAAQNDFVLKFQEEAKLTRRAFQGQKHVRQVLDMGVWTFDNVKSPWMAMDLLEGQTLGEALRERRGSKRPRSEAEVLAFFRPVLEVIAFAHSKGVAHRDIKPANIFISSEDGGTLKVLDFGIAKVMQGEEIASGNTMTSSTMQMFSPQYGAPEQFAAKKTGKYTDIFALGLILTELLSDAAPLSELGDRTECMLAALDKRDRPTPRKRGATGISDATEAVIEKALAISEAERWPDASALLAALDAAVGATASAVDAGSAVHTHFAERVTDFRATPATPAQKRPQPETSSRQIKLALAGGGALIATAIAVAVLYPRAPAPADEMKTARSDTAPSALAAASASAAPPVESASPAAAPPTGGSTPGPAPAPIAVADLPQPKAAGGQTKPAAPALKSAEPAKPQADSPGSSGLSAGARSAAAVMMAPPAESPPPEPPKATESAAAFDRGMAAAALGAVNVQSCKKEDGPVGSGHVTVTFGPDGSVQSAVVDQGPFPGTPVGGCIAGKFRSAHVPAFGGAPVRVGKSFTIK